MGLTSEKIDELKRIKKDKWLTNKQLGKELLATSKKMGMSRNALKSKLWASTDVVKQTSWTNAWVWDIWGKWLKAKDSKIVDKKVSKDMFDSDGKKTWERSNAAVEYLKGKKTIDVPTVDTPTDTTTVPANDFILWVDELSASDKSKYDELSDIEKTQFKAMWENAKKNWQDYAKAQAEYLVKVKEEKEYRLSQKEKKDKITTLSWEITEIQSSQRIANAKIQLDNLKQNVAYLGTLWRPWVSSKKLSAMDNQITLAETTFKNLKIMEANMAEIQKIWEDYDSDAFERGLQTLQDQLDTQVNWAIQEALNSFSAAEIEGKLESIEDVEALRIELLENLDKEITWVSDANIQQRAFLINRYDLIAEKKIEFIENKNVFKEHPGKYWVDGNGTQITWTDWNIIKIEGKPLFSWMETQADWSKKFVVIQEWEDWKPVATMTDVMDAPSFTQQTISDWATFVSKWGNINDVPDHIKEMPAFIKQVADAPVSDTETPLDRARREKIEAETDELTWWADTTVSKTELINWVDTFISTKVDWEKGWQCWEFTNDYLQSLWLSRMFTDPFEKKKAVTNSTTPTVGSVAVMDSPLYPEYWHTGIVTKVNDDWTIEIKESNVDWKETINTRTINSNKVFGYYDPNKWDTKQDITDTREYKQAVNWLLWQWTESERALIAKDIAQYATEQKVSVQEAKAELYPDTLSRKDRTKLEITIANDLDKDIEWYGKSLWQIDIIQTAYDMAQKQNFSWDSINAASQWVLVAFQKMLDPTSVVRESEYARSWDWLSLINRIEWTYTKLKQWWAWVSAEDLKEFVDTANAFWNWYKKSLVNFVWRTKKQIDNYWLNEENILTKNVLDLYNEIWTPEELRKEHYSDWSYVEENDDWRTYNYKDRDGNMFENVPVNTSVTPENAPMYLKKELTEEVKSGYDKLYVPVAPVVPKSDEELFNSLIK